MWQELTSLWQTLRNPAYSHLLLEQLPLFGVGIGLLFLFVAMLGGESKSRLLALVIICASCASVWFYLDLRGQAIPRIVGTKDASYAPLIRAQAERRAAFAWAYYAEAALAGLALIFCRGGKGRFLMFLTLAGALGIFWLSLWLHKKECEVFHRDIVRERAVR